MGEIREILVSDLLLDMENPRLPEQNSQLGTILAMVSVQKEKLAVLAEDIVTRGINTSELFIVMPADEEQIQYVVLEGNRRLAALKLLATPELLTDATPDVAPVALRRRFRELSKKFQGTPIESLFCAVNRTREEADPWIKLRHTGENKGAGIVRWGGREVAAYTARLSGRKAPHLQVLDFVTQSGRLSEAAAAQLDRISITNLERLINTAYVKDKLGIEVEGGQVATKFRDDEVLKGLVRLVEDIALNKINVSDIRTVTQRRDYINGFAKQDLPDISTPTGAVPRRLQAEPVGMPSNSPESTETPARKKSSPASTTRATLVPKGCVLTIGVPRVNKIYRELRRLKVEEFPNAVAVLLRVFLELSIDEFIDCNEVSVNEKPVSKNDKLAYKLTQTCQYLKDNQLMDVQRLTPVLKIASDNRFLAASIPTFHAYVHNPHFSPHVQDLKAAWDELQAFMEHIWR